MRLGMKRTRSPAPPSDFIPDFTFEAALYDKGTRFVAGVDEAGRGPLAGPVVAAAVILDPAAIPSGLNDSKKLTMRAREDLFAAILASSTVAFATAGPEEIDRINIRAASLLAMTRAVEALPGNESHACHCLIDGKDVPPGLSARGTALVSGDARSLSIAAASIVAKVMRDRIMIRLSDSFPAFGFARHMGYGTKLHLDALSAQGRTPHHRFSFGPVRNAKAAG